jgi:hypothetical protein
MHLNFITPTAPAKLIAAREHAEKLRGAIARATETANATAAAIAEAEKAYRAECSAAALDGTAHPKTPAALRDLRERAETAENTKADLEALLLTAGGTTATLAHYAAQDAMRAEIARRSELAREAFADFTDAAERLSVLVGQGIKPCVTVFANRLNDGDAREDGFRAALAAVVQPESRGWCELTVATLRAEHKMPTGLDFADAADAINAKLRPTL